jgi:hypothetical protein
MTKPKLSEEQVNKFVDHTILNLKETFESLADYDRSGLTARTASTAKFELSKILQIIRGEK